MRAFFSVALIFSILCISAPGITQEEEVAPIFQEIPYMMYETYEGVNRPVFNEYFEMLVERYEGTDARWAIFNENGSVAHRLTGLPEGFGSRCYRRQAGQFPGLHLCTTCSLGGCLGNSAGSVV